MDELTRAFVLLAEIKDPTCIEIFLSIVSNWQDYTDAEKVDYLNYLDKDAALLLQQVGASGVNNSFTFLVIISEGITARTMYEFLGLLSIRLMTDMTPVNTTMLSVFRQSMNFLALTNHRNN